MNPKPVMREHRIVAGMFASAALQVLVTRAASGLALVTFVADPRLFVGALVAERPALVMVPSIDDTGSSTAHVVDRCAEKSPRVPRLVVLTRTESRPPQAARAYRSAASLVCRDDYGAVRRAIRELLGLQPPTLRLLE